MADSSSSPLQPPVFEQPWEKNTNSIWLATTISIHRNIDKFHFPKRLDTEKRRLVSQIITEALKAIPLLQDIRIFPGSSLKPIDREFLTEHFLVFEVTHDNQHSNDFVTEKYGTILVQINANDHVHLHVIEPSTDLEKAFGRLSALEQEIEKHLPFSFSNHFGFLTSDPCQSGTGLVINAYIHIPALIELKAYQTVIDPSLHEGLFFTSLQENFNDLIGDLLVVRNRWTTGISEETILSSVHNAAVKIVAEEQSARAAIQKEKNNEVIDRISRAIGLVRHSFMMGTSESLRALSQIKLGIEFGWITGMSIEAINELFFDCRRAHLARKINPELYASPDLYKVRAQYFHEIMEPIALNV
jgi:protein arginine kinase